ncbi:ABC transporter ATP-binding protein [Alkalihalobacillus trypoxylicola]|uniref:Bacitracin ABC transporter ATP-binding protein n=1 Tax=Alkalihalobacillus trypoxylicola TaxID=519424 RepID=A0A161QIK5_9BACI|nr:ABC transporter ATP-binding protein [Alkalihalobacillus trypoxylicola]KYG29348.1 bacitracin ABC transporter ATP-binding protein [Alkalihalobacillus trypoxylicola]
METLLSVKEVGKVYGKGTSSFDALRHISFDIDYGEFVGVMGPSGSGKSTLLNVLATIDKPSSGEIHLEENNLVQMKEGKLADFRKKHLGFIFQEYNLLDSLTVKENILLPLAIAKKKVKDIEETIDKIVKAFGIDYIIDQYPYQISGGQKQRAAACRALITNPKLVFADEPTGALDSKSAKSLLETLRSMNDDHETTIMMVTHDAFAASFCRRILFLKDGEIFKEIFRGSQSREQFYQSILEELAQMGGGDNHDTV